MKDIVHINPSSHETAPRAAQEFEVGRTIPRPSGLNPDVDVQVEIAGTVLIHDA